MNVPQPYLCALWLAITFVTAGSIQSVWLYSGFAKRFGRPLDGGRTYRGKRIFGDNKTWRGFVVMVPAVGLAFMTLGLLRDGLGIGYENGLWEISVWKYGAAGCAAGLGFMLAELPNSFLKRQLGVQPGKAPHQRWARPVCFLLDQVDSVIGAMLALSMFVPIPLTTWIILLFSGSVIHWLFNLVLFLLGAKQRPA